VLGGYPLTHQRIADELSLTLGAVRYQMKRLEENGYLRITRCREGQIIEVARSIKWNNRKQKAKVPEEPRGDSVPSLSDRLRKRQESREH
jgi:DNA-binding Lrp family transcriptional regulator